MFNTARRALYAALFASMAGPVFAADWAPEDVYVDDVFACGDWAVMATDDGWFGWTPSAPGEQEVAPSPKGD